MTTHDTHSQEETSAIMDDVASLSPPDFIAHKKEWCEYAIDFSIHGYPTDTWDWMSADPKKREKQLSDLMQTLDSMRLRYEDKKEIAGLKLYRMLNKLPERPKNNI